MEQSPGTPSHAHPRYRVRTLLIATTMAAVVLACLAPWLRGLSAQWWMMLASRMGIFASGALLAVIFAQIRYHYFEFQSRSSRESISAKCSRVRTNPTVGIGLLVLILPASVLLDTVVPVLRFSVSPGVTSGNWIPLGLVVSQYLTCGAVLGTVYMRALTRQTDVRLTADRFISRGITTRWNAGMRFRWLDRTAGKMLLILPTNGQFELSIDEHQVEAAEQLLTKNLPPWH
jgi:hypothetical protein